MKVIIACEFSGVVRDAFLRRGHEALSCDLLPGEGDGPHFQGDLRDVIDYPWDLMIAHPPCQHLSVSGARWFPEKASDGRQQSAISFFMWLSKAEIPRICIENPVSIMSTAWRKPEQIIQPWEFGHGETKATCFWLKNLPPLQSTEIVEGREQRVHLMSPGPGRGRERSRTYLGVAEGMAKQWGDLGSL